MKKSLKVSLLAILTALPTALGYVLGPLTHTADLIFTIFGIPFKLHLGFMPLVISVILARAYIGRSGALIEGILLGVTSIFFHSKSEPPIIRVPKDILLGLGVELAMLRYKKIDIWLTIFSALIGGFFSYIPYLFFTPLGFHSLIIYYISIIILMFSYLISCILAGYLAGIILERTQALNRLVKK